MLGRRARGAVRPQYCSLLCAQVVATDSVSKKSSIATVTIHLTDINDHRPTFPERSYNLSLLEDSATGTVVTSSIHVSDTRCGWPGWEAAVEKGRSGNCGVDPDVRSPPFVPGGRTALSP